MVFTPKTADEVAEFFNTRTEPTHISSSSENSSGRDTLSLSELNKVLLYEPEEMIISVEAGISLLKLSQILAQHKQWIPTLVPNESLSLTLGAAVAEDHYQPRAKSLGMLRTTILGGSFCMTDGTLFKSGSRVVKSVAGYDIHRAFCGSRGRFGAIIALTLKVQPLPEVFFRFTALPKDKNIIREFNPTVFEELDGMLLVELAGYNEDISYEKERLLTTVNSLKELSNDHWCNHLKSIQLQKQQQRISSEAMTLILKTRSVFDPKQILV